MNERGVAFYDRLVDGLLEAGITPFATLYHWDLPQVLEDQGGWPSRVVPEAFAEYTTAVVERLGDRVKRWATINEPFVVSHLGYITGEHAPGRRSLADGLDATHHVLLAHGLAVERIRAITPDAEVGIVLNFTPAVRAGDAPAAIDRHRIIDDLENRWFADAVAGKGYPAETADRLGWDRAVVRDGDLDLIAQPIDFLGVNFYTRQHIGAFEREKIGPLGAATAMGWEIHAPALGGLLRDLHARYGFSRYLISENGAAMPDLGRTPDGRGGRPRPDRLLRRPPRRGARGDRGGRTCRGLLRVVPARQLRMGVGLRAEVRAGRGRRHHPGAEAQAERTLVPRRRPGQRPSLITVRRRARPRPPRAGRRQHLGIRAVEPGTVARWSPAGPPPGRPSAAHRPGAGGAAATSGSPRCGPWRPTVWMPSCSPAATPRRSSVG